MDDFVRMAADTFSWSELKILQHLFWLAYDLKLHFRRDGENLSPRAAKKILIQSPEPSLQIVLNKPVAETVFCGVKNFFKQITADTDSLESLDQTEFARRLAREIRDWKRALESYRPFAQQPGFPGERDIDACQAVIEKISLKSDSFSLIHAFYENTGPIAELLRTIKNLSDFYFNRGEKWQLLVRFAQESQNTVTEILEDPAAAEAYQRFNRILSSQRPYERLNDAWQLMETVKPCHEKIVARQTQRCRNAALSDINSLIEKIKKHLKTHAAPEDLCNQSLYALRTEIKCINAATTIHMINHYAHAAEEAFEAAWEEVLDHGQ